MSTAEVLRAARAKVDTPAKWWQSGGHNDNEVDLETYCAWLALVEVDPGLLRFSVADTFITANGISPEGCVVARITEWNDDPSRTHAEVLTAFDRAIELAEAER